MGGKLFWHEAPLWGYLLGKRGESKSRDIWRDDPGHAPACRERWSSCSRVPEKEHQSPGGTLEITHGAVRPWRLERHGRGWDTKDSSGRDSRGWRWHIWQGVVVIVAESKKEMGKAEGREIGRWFCGGMCGCACACAWTATCILRGWPRMWSRIRRNDQEDFPWLLLSI